MNRIAVFTALLALFALAAPPAARAGEEARQVQAGVVYLPVYSQVLLGDKAKPYLLAATVCIRNLSRLEPVTVESAYYLDSDGQVIKQYLEAPRTLAPIGTLTLTVPESEKRGGSGAKFLIRWRADKPVPPPLAEAVMAGTSGQQGISFTTRGIDLPGTD
jgi:hypothetical protein